MSDAWIADALEETWATIYYLIDTFPEDLFDWPTPCPGWSIRDLVCHLIGWERYYNEGYVPNTESVSGDFIKNELGVLNQGYILSMRTLAAGQLPGLFGIETARSSIRLRDMTPEEYDQIVTTPLGESASYRFRMETRIFDSWIHLQDLRDAMLRPEDDHTVGEEVVIARFEATLPSVIKGATDFKGGELVRINLSGRLARSMTFRCQPEGVFPVEYASEEPIVELTTPVSMFWRRCAGRISAEAFLGESSTRAVGTVAVAMALARGLATTR